VKANQTISNLQSDLETTQVGAETHKAEYDTKVTRFQSNNSNLQSELRGLKREVADDKRTLSLGIADFKQWMRENSVKADKLISDPDPSVSSSDIHHVLAHNALVKVGLDKWSSAYEDAKKVFFHSLIGVLVFTHPHVKSLVTRPSAMGYIAQALARIGMGEPEEAMQAFDLAFGNCNPKESNLLLLIKVCDRYVSQAANRLCHLDHHVICGPEM
jgi:hypothetical protein